MSARYLLPCSCGASIPVAASQAGGALRCEACQATLDVPRLRDLRELPVEAVATRAGSGWSFRLGVLTAGVLLATALAAGAGYFAATEPAPPAPFDAEARKEMVETGLDNLPPKELFQMFVQMYEPMAARGIEKLEPPRNRAINKAIENSQLYRDILLYAAGGVLAVALGSFALLPK